MNGYYVKILPTISPSSAFKDYEADEAVSGQYVHSMFGNRPTTGAMCPNCRMPLTPFLNLNLADGRISFLSLFGKQLVLYYCLGCAIPFGEFQYRLDADGRVSVLRYEAGVLSPEDGWEGYRRYFTQCPASLLEYSDATVQLLRDYSVGSISGVYLMYHVAELGHLVHQVGGYPYLAQRAIDQRMACHSCGKDMEFLATICDDTLDHEKVFGNTFAQIVYQYCAACCVIGAVTELD